MSAPDVPGPAATATKAAEAIRALNHATHAGAGGYQEPADVSDTLTALTAMAERLPQALNQAQAWLTAEYEAGRVGDDQGGQWTTSVRLLELADFLSGAQTYAAALARQLRRAAETTSHLTGIARDDTEQEGDQP